MPDLLVQGHEIKVIPCLDNLSVVDPDNSDASDFDRGLSRSSAEEVSFMRTTHGAARSDFVTFGNHVLDNDHYVWEALAEHFVKRL